MKNAVKLIFTTAILYISLPVFSQIQDRATIDFYELIKYYDLSKIWTADSILAENIEGSKEMHKRSEPVGYIGNDFQRFYIHFISAIKKQNSPYEYLVFGKTKVKNTLCDFLGTIKIIGSKQYDKSELPDYKEGYVVCEIQFFEDSKQPSTGYISGKMVTNFLIDSKNKFRYNAIMFPSDEFCNNQCGGNWINYKTKEIKKCNWGDYRIPDSKGLDIGAGFFSVDEKYVKNGWENYMLSILGKPDSAEVKEARKKELEEWWK
jgi:hypothetical protein